MFASITPQHDDPFFFDREGLEAVASAVVGEGLRSFKEHRVLSVDQDQGGCGPRSTMPSWTCPARWR